MSIASISSNIESSGSIFFEPKSLRRFESSCSENFQAFLSTSPYGSLPVSPPNLRDRANYPSKREQIKELEDSLEYIDPKKRPLTSADVSQMSTTLIKLCDTADESPEYTSGTRPDVNNAVKAAFAEAYNTENRENQPMQQRNKHRVLRVHEVYNQGFDSPKGKDMDRETRDLIKGLQSRIVMLEREVLKLRRENHDLTQGNKKLNERMTIVIEEQEKAAKARVEYENKISRLRENCQNNKQIVSSLKEILTLQEGEFYDRAVKKEKASLQSLVDIKRKSLNRTTTSHIRTATSLEAIMDPPQENKSTREPAKQKPILKSSTRSSIGKGSLTSLHSRKISVSKVSIRET